jgi:TAZ zinc finger.
MRTKSIEKKRYSLRLPRKNLIDIENSKESGKRKEEQEQPNVVIANENNNKLLSPPLTKKAKRKGKPVKSAPQDGLEEAHQQRTSSTATTTETSPMMKKPSNEHCKIKISEVPADEQIPVQIVSSSPKATTVETCSSSGTITAPSPSVSVVGPTKKAITNNKKGRKTTSDFPVYTALEHATKCRVGKGCTFQKCAIAKQFLSHSTSCNEKKDECTICKAMDIMVCKHAEKCELPLEKHCLIPNCDHVRHMMMEEWVKFKNNHHEIVTRAFGGLIHARRCREKTCESVLCRNIKAVLLHTQTCNKKEACKTRGFIVQLCEYHQETCVDDKCQVEFCVENRRMIEEENMRKVSI